MLAFALGCAIFIAQAARAAGADADPSDLWWNPAESGWGMQLVQGGSAVFATLFVYDGTNSATFFTATLAQSGTAWSGTLYQTTGPYFGDAVFTPAHVNARAVGRLSFSAASAVLGVLQYTVDGAAVTKTVERQVLRFDDYAGRYAITTQRVATSCADAAANGDMTVAEALVIQQLGRAMSLDWTSAKRVCRLAGNFNQAGKLGFAETAYTCSDGEAGSLSLFELTIRNGFIFGRFQGHAISNGCDYRGQFAGLVPS